MLQDAPARPLSSVMNFRSGSVDSSLKFGLGSFASARQTLLGISSTAIVLVLWLSLSFWNDAWNQKRGAVTMLRDIDTENLLVDMAREIGVERILASHLIAPGTLNEPLREELRSALGESRAALDTQKEQLLSRQQNELPVSGVISNQVHFRNLEAPLNRLLTARDYIDKLLSNPNEVYDPSRLAIALNEFDFVVDALLLLRDGLRMRSSGKDLTLERVLRLRNSASALGESVSQTAALMPQLLAKKMTNGQVSQIRSTIADRAAKRAWTQMQILTSSAPNDFELDQSVATLRQTYEQRFERIRSQLLLQIDQNETQTAISSWLTLSRTTLDSIAEFDGLLRTRAQEHLNGIKSHAIRRLIIDTFLLIVCVVLVVASMKLLATIGYQATHDQLTGLVNRRQFEARLTKMVGSISDTNSHLTLLYLNLNNFAQFNDSLGHDTGDQILQLIGRRLQEIAVKPEAAARMDGDEFAVLIDSMPTSATADILEPLTASIEIDGLTIHISACVGFAVFPQDASCSRELLSRANIAMYEAKKVGGSAILRFNTAMAGQYRKRAELERELTDAIERNEIFLHYQPQVDLANGHVTGLEALVRWRHPIHGMISPGVFIPIAEQSGLIYQIGPWVINEACRQMAKWRGEQQFNARIAVNISAKQFTLDNLTQSILKALETHALSPEFLEIEVTESVVMTDLEPVIKKLNCLRESGIKVALDDFGTGYSSLSYLDQLPLDYLKIDRAFVQRLDVSAPSDSLIHKIQLLADSFGLETIAEGVETEEQLATIAELGCDVVQGYVYSKPVPASEVPETIARIEGSWLNRAA